METCLGGRGVVRIRNIRMNVYAKKFVLDMYAHIGSQLLMKVKIRFFCLYLCACSRNINSAGHSENRLPTAVCGQRTF